MGTQILFTYLRPLPTWTQEQRWPYVDMDAMHSHLDQQQHPSAPPQTPREGDQRSISRFTLPSTYQQTSTYPHSRDRPFFLQNYTSRCPRHQDSLTISDRFHESGSFEIHGDIHITVSLQIKHSAGRQVSGDTRECLVWMFYSIPYSVKSQAIRYRQVAVGRSMGCQQITWECLCVSTRSTHWLQTDTLPNKVNS